MISNVPMSEHFYQYKSSDTNTWSVVTGATVSEDGGASQNDGDGTIQLRKGIYTNYFQVLWTLCITLLYFQPAVTGLHSQI